DTAECSAGAVTCPDDGNIMFWTGGGARSRLSAGQGAVMRRHPLVAAAAPPALPVAECDAGCAAPETCVVLGARSTCAVACDPETARLQRLGHVVGGLAALRRGLDAEHRHAPRRAQQFRHLTLVVADDVAMRHQERRGAR